MNVLDFVFKLYRLKKLEAENAHLKNKVRNLNIKVAGLRAEHLRLVDLYDNAVAEKNTLEDTLEAIQHAVAAV